MSRSLLEILRFRVDALDGEIGSVADFLIDDTGWLVRHCVVETGGWLSGRKVLVDPEAMTPPDTKRRTLPVNLERETVANAPRVDADAPVALRQEARLRTVYGWPNRRSSPEEGLLAPTPREIVESQVRAIAVANTEGDPHLRSSQEVVGYRILARGEDEEVGRLEDFLVDDRTWVIRYLVVKTAQIPLGRKILLSPAWVSEVRWSDESIVLDLAREKIDRSPELRPERP